ncbi:MAG: hypothetical protein C4K48_02935 [Candidatus Thorarchaeota archaeon]|nr:MAG: hypothetical protein C4K48_02935 [Candidatus Thorarchaeota archaeon]
MFEILAHPAVSGLLVMGAFGALAYKLHFVDISGLISAFIVGFTIWYTGGVSAFVIVLFYFLSAGIATKYKYKAKMQRNCAQEGKGKRSWKNVFGSGLIPMMFSVAMYLASLVPDLAAAGWPFFLFGGYIGAVSTTAADTLASELGVFSRSKPRLITNLRRKVPTGTIGGVSLLGEAVAILAGLTIGVIAVLFSVFAPGWVPAVTAVDQVYFLIPLTVLTGFIGCNVDSVLGAVFQNRYVCEICGAVTDKEFHCDYETKYVGGFKSFTNMHVNFGSSGMGATLGVLLGAGLFVWILGGLFFWIAASSSS